jgi:hypothetical protein
MTGVVVEINDLSSTFVIRDNSARQITCVLGPHLNDASLSVSVGDRVSVRGDFTRRSRRDKLIIDAAPQVLPKAKNA